MELSCMHVIIESMHPWKTLKCFLLPSLVWVTGWLAMLFNLHLWTVVFHAPLFHKVPPPTTSPTPAHGPLWETGIEFQIELFTWKCETRKVKKNPVWNVQRGNIFFNSFSQHYDASELKTVFCRWVGIDLVGTGSKPVITTPWFIGNLIMWSEQPKIK